MNPAAEPASAADFCRIAVEQKLLKPAIADKLAEHIAMRKQPPGELAVELHLLEPVDVDIIQTLLRPTHTVPGYEIIDVLGRGGMGVVYRARQMNLDRIVALKSVLISQMAQPGALARFEQEALTVAKLTHPNIVAAYDFGKQGGRFFLAMELLTGEDTESLIARRKQLDEPTTWCLARQAAAGLAHAANKAGVVHRDVKPANLFLTAPPEGFPLPAGMPLVKITDFGLALLTRTAHADIRLTVSGTTLGSPHYMSPEQFSGSDVDLRADIYSLGASVFQMLAGTAPYHGGTLAQVISQKMSGTIPDLRRFAPHVSRQTISLLEAMMAHDVKQRIRDYEQLLRRIDALPKFAPAASPQTAALPAAVVSRATADANESYQATRTMASTPTTGMSPAQPVRGSRRMLVFVTAAALATVAAGGAWWWWGRGPQMPERPTLVHSGWESQLYDGQSLSGWQTIGGGWSQAKNAEGGSVLSGDGRIRRQVLGPDGQPLVNYRVSVNVDLHDALAVELHFALQTGNGRDPPRYVLRVARDACVLGSRPSDLGPLTETTRAAGLPTGDPTEGPKYHELKVERHDRAWWAFIDGQPLGVLPASIATELPEFRLVTEGGAAHFDAPLLAELTAPK